MKHYLLITLFSMATLVGIGQQPDFINQIEKKPVFTPDPGGGSQTSVIGQKLSEALIGETWYDLQTYGALGQRTWAYSDGTLGATWMMAFETTAWADRGIGYNYYDGNSWNSFPATSIASIRTGWACYAPLGENGEIAVGHALPDASGDWVLWFCKRANKGTGVWEEFTLSGPEAGVGIVWPAMTTGGTDHNTLHVLGRTYGTAYMGQDGALVYSRSTDGGQTWDIQNHFFDEIGPDYFTSIDADGYAWANPRGNTIAFSVGFDVGHACIMKSNDNGDNWEFIEVFNCPFYPAPGGETPTFGAGDGTQACAIDSQGNVHVVYGRMRHVYDATGAGFYYPATDGLIYWNETMPPLDTTIISSYTLQFLQENGNLVGWVTGDGIAGLMEFPSYYTSLTSHPQIIIDQTDRIFVVWNGAAPGYNNGTWNYRHIYGNSSNDGGLTWNEITDFNDALSYLFSECVYPSLAPTIFDGELHMTFQNDTEPGIFVWAAQQAAAGPNNITYMSKSTAFLTGLEDQNPSGNQVTVSQNFPNPFRGVTYIDAEIPAPSEVVFTVTDITGKIVHHEMIGKVTSQTLRIRFDGSRLSSGLYYYTVQSDSGASTGKMMIE